MARTGQQEVLAEQRQTPQQQVEAQLVAQQADADRFAKQAATLRSQATALKTTGVGVLANIKKRDDLNAQAAALEAQHAAALGQLQATATLYRGAYGNGPANSSIAKIVSSFGAKPTLPMTQKLIGPPTPAAQPAPPAPTATPAETSPQPSAGVGTKENPQYVATPPVTLTQQQIRARYGYLGALLDNPDIAALISERAADPSMSDDEFLAKLYDTPTWRTTQTSVRNYIGLQSSDPAGLQATITQKQADIVAQAKTLGVDIAPDRLSQLATDSVRFAWSATQLQNAIGAEFHYKPGAQAGQLGQAETTLRKMADDYMVPLTDTTLQAYEQRIAAGTDTAENFRQDFIQQAKGLWTGMEKQLDRGLTTQQIVSPYRQMAANELQIDPDSIDFTQPKWMAALNAPTDPKTGERQMLGLGDWLTKLRSDDTYGWDKTVAGKTAYTQMGNALTQALGLRPGG